jgi:hypothetical protein
MYSEDQSYQASGTVGANGVVWASVCRGWPIRIGLRQAVAQFRRRKLAVIERRMLRHLVSVVTSRLLLS